MSSVDLDSTLQLYPLESLRQMSTFGAVSDAFIKQALSLSQIINLKKGEILFKKGDNPDEFFIVLEGNITVYDTTNTGQHIIRTTETGESIGFSSMIGLRPRLFSGAASYKCTVLRISSRAFAELYDWDLQQFAIFFMNLSRDMSRFLRDSTYSNEK